MQKHFEIGTIIIKDSDGKKVRRLIHRPTRVHQEKGYNRTVKHKGQQNNDN